MMAYKEKVNKLMSGLKSFEDMIKILDGVPADKGGIIIRGYIMDYIEKKYPEKFFNYILNN